MNESIVQGKWKEIKGEIQKMWGKLTSDELEQTKGNVTAIGGLIQQKYGVKKEEYSDKLDSLVSSFSRNSAEAKENAQRDARQATDKIKNDLKNKSTNKTNP